MGDARAVFEERPIEERASQDPSRPRLHFLPPANWMNDPCGLIQWRGQYHLFYQYNPNGVSHSTIHWGHAVSSDLVHWTHLPIALAPTPGGADASGCWTGCAVDRDGVPTLAYTGVHPQTVCLATGSDDLMTWQKYEGNPVIAAPPPGVRARAGGNFRDPYVWKEDGWWYLIIGSRVKDVGGLILLYRSPDLVHWEYLHPLMVGDIHAGDPCRAGTMWECPNLLKLGDSHILLFSIQATAYDHLHPVYHVGGYADQRFTPEAGGVLVHGDFYAPQVMHLDDGRHILWGWIEEGRSQHASEQAGWAGTLSLPLVLRLQPDSRLALEPVRELQALRGEHWHLNDLELLPEHGDSGTEDCGSRGPLGTVRGDCLEIMADFEQGDGAEVGIALRCSQDGQEQTRIVYQAAQGQLTVERDDSSKSRQVDRGERTAPVELASGESLKLHIFLDRSVLEIFGGGGRTCLATRIYPTQTDSLGIRVFARSGTAVLKSIDIWALGSIWT